MASSFYSSGHFATIHGVRMGSGTVLQSKHASCRAGGIPYFHRVSSLQKRRENLRTQQQLDWEKDCVFPVLDGEK